MKGLFSDTWLIYGVFYGVLMMALDYLAAFKRISLRKSIILSHLKYNGKRTDSYFSTLPDPSKFFLQHILTITFLFSVLPTKDSYRAGSQGS